MLVNYSPIITSSLEDDKKEEQFMQMQGFSSKKKVISSGEHGGGVTPEGRGVIHLFKTPQEASSSIIFISDLPQTWQQQKTLTN